ncbi:Dyp-type peroxidase [Streptomyces sp. S.PB5]|uniref:Dyp-type peroxidase n=1 Tax=Streptomyces sp. S.PB5 TaxID=3020844 RepID=UPI0025AF3F06|nr:Dyp-type peroxidase [Streptomyces sp. S.PB5]MDN3025996.1 Dyp-type peroxidase [Streptomyces sp. S.PB5]
MISTPSDSPPPTRRSLLTATAALALLTAGCAEETRQQGSRPTEDNAARKRTDSRRALSRQGGISGPQPLHATIAAYDLAPHHGGSAATAVGGILEHWSALRVPEAATRTIALGPALYRKLGLTAPARLRDIPAFSRDRLDPHRGGGDILVQLCGDDPEALTELSRRLTASSAGTLLPRWRERGFLPAHPPGETPRNLFGFKDGTENPTTAEAERWVWNPDGSTYLVYRRIHMDVPTFTALSHGRQEAVVGRQRTTGAPLGGDHEHDPANLYAKTAQGRYVIPADAHVRLAHSRLDGGARMLRRGYSYDNGSDDRGLLFLAYMRDPALFARAQERLDHSDAMNHFVEHRASAVGYVVPATGGGLLPGR